MYVCKYLAGFETTPNDRSLRSTYVTFLPLKRDSRLRKEHKVCVKTSLCDAIVRLASINHVFDKSSIELFDIVSIELFDSRRSNSSTLVDRSCVRQIVNRSCARHRVDRIVRHRVDRIVRHWVDQIVRHRVDQIVRHRVDRSCVRHVLSLSIDRMDYFSACLPQRNLFTQ
jgi:hypothetical protein